MKKIIGFGFALLLLLNMSCKDSLDINAEWKNIPVVYALISQADSIHYVKVNKAFLGNVPASVMAQQSDSLFYDDVQVWINKIENGTTVQQINFTAVDTIQKPEGYFASDRNTLYVWKGKLDATSPADVPYEYELNVYIPSINMTCKSAEAIKLIRNVSITKPFDCQKIVLTHYNSTVKSEYRTGIGANLYQMIFKFYYIEVNSATGDTIKNIEPLVIPMSKDPVSLEGAEIKKELLVSSFYELAKNKIPVKDGYTRFARYPYPVEFVLVAADENYKIYSEVSAPSSGIVQEKPFFTNIENGVGLFAARHKVSRKVKLSPYSLDSLAYGKYTKHLNFADRNHPYYQ